MQSPAIVINNISKYYSHAGETNPVYAVRNISLEIAEGSVVGIVGKNGCGKSTMLKLIAGIIKPSEGRITTHGNVLALTDIGAGFHPELSGRENVIMNGILYGLTKEQAKAILPDVLEFSELGNYIDTPVKNYSQGMFLRLAFGLMIHLPVDIVLLDEVLAVGDEAFRKKCYDRIQLLVRKGATLLLVTHNFDEAAALCNRCIVLEKGEIVADGKPEEVYNKYIRSLTPVKPNGAETATIGINDRLEFLRQGFVQVNAIHIENGGNATGGIVFTDSIAVVIEWEKLKPEGAVYFDVLLADKINRPVVATSNYYGKNIEKETVPNQGKTGKFISKCILPANFINHGLFKVSVNGTLYYGRDNYFSIFLTNEPFELQVRNPETISNELYWLESNAPVRTGLTWSEAEL